MTDIRFLGQSCFELTDGTVKVLFDPFLTGNPKGAAKADDLSPDVILLTHGHGDHYGDIVDIAKRAGSTVVSIVEIANELSEAGIEDVRDPNFGGTVEFDWGWVRLVPAWHTSTTPSGTVAIPTGMVVSIGGKVVYHLGDTCLFSDLQLVGRRNPVDVALVPIGGHYTMDRHDAVTAVEFDRPEHGHPLPLRHVPADRDRRRGVQVRRGGLHRGLGGHPRPRRDPLGLT